MKPTKSERRFMQFLLTIDFGFKMKIHANAPFQVHERTLFPDFRLEPARLIVEIDGSVHWDKAADRDCQRDFLFEERGYRTLHISNQSVYSMSPERFVELILSVYPTFPNPDGEMIRLHKIYREKDMFVKPVGYKDYLVVRQKKMKRHDKHLLEQHLQWKRMQGNVDSLPDRQERQGSAGQRAESGSELIGQTFHSINGY